MDITDIRIRKLFPEGRLRALVSLTVGGDLAVHDIKVIDGPERTVVAMPYRREDTGRYRDIIHPITSEARVELETAILAAYERALAAQEEDPAAFGSGAYSAGPGGLSSGAVPPGVPSADAVRPSHGGFVSGTAPDADGGAGIPFPGGRFCGLQPPMGV